MSKNIFIVHYVAHRKRTEKDIQTVVRLSFSHLNLWWYQFYISASTYFMCRRVYFIAQFQFVTNFPFRSLQKANDTWHYSMVYVVQERDCLVVLYIVYRILEIAFSQLMDSVQVLIYSTCIFPCSLCTCQITWAASLKVSNTRHSFLT